MLPKMMSVGIHLRLTGHAGRAIWLERFLDHVQSQPDVWLCRRIDIARHWIEHHPRPNPADGENALSTEDHDQCSSC